MSKFLNTYKKLLKKVQTIQFYSKIFERITRFLWAKERMSNSLKKEQFAHSLFYHERPEQIANGCSFVVAHGCSFVLSDLSKSLTVAHLTSANWVNERMINQPYKSFTILPFLAFYSLRFFFTLLGTVYCIMYIQCYIFLHFSIKATCKSENKYVSEKYHSMNITHPNKNLTHLVRL